MPGRKRKVWVWLTWQQIAALLAAADVIDRTPEALEAVLPTVGERAAFPGAIAALKDVRDAPSIDLGERLLAHGKGRKGLVLDGEAMPFVIEAPFVRVDQPVHELPPASGPSDGNGS